MKHNTVFLPRQNARVYACTRRMCACFMVFFFFLRREASAIFVTIRSHRVETNNDNIIHKNARATRFQFNLRHANSMINRARPRNVSKRNAFGIIEQTKRYATVGRSSRTPPPADEPLEWCFARAVFVSLRLLLLLLLLLLLSLLLLLLLLLLHCCYLLCAPCRALCTNNEVAAAFSAI